MIKAIGLELHWLPTEIGSLFVNGNNMYSINYWYNAVQEKK